MGENERTTVMTPMLGPQRISVRHLKNIILRSQIRIEEKEVINETSNAREKRFEFPWEASYRHLP
jgi:hypothetical protein